MNAAMRARRFSASSARSTRPALGAGAPGRRPRRRSRIAQRLGAAGARRRGCWRRAASARRGAGDFLEPTLRALLPDPSHLTTWTRAVARLAGAVRGGEPIAVFGDYDVDGATSVGAAGALLPRRRRRHRRLHPGPHEEGYGPNAPALRGCRREGARVVVTRRLRHHRLRAAGRSRARPGSTSSWSTTTWPRPRCRGAARWSIPNRLDETSPHTQLAAVGVAFLLVVGVNRALARGRLVRRAAAGAGPAAAGSTSWRWARSATWCRSPASTARWCARA